MMSLYYYRIRHMPLHLQQLAFHKGLIPYVPGERNNIGSLFVLTF